MSDVGKRLKAFRLERGLTQKEVAEPQYTHAYISTIESGKRVPSQKAASHFATRLGVGVEELMTGLPPDLALRLELELNECRRLLSSGEHEAAEAALEKVLRQARRYRLKRLESKTVRLQAFKEERASHLRKAIDLYEKAEALLEGEPENLKVEALVGRSRCLQMSGETRFAIHLLESFLALLERKKVADPLSVGRIQASLAFDYLLAGLYEKASQAASVSLDLLPIVTAPEQSANMYMNVARVLASEGAVDDASQALERAEELFRQLDFKIELCRAHVARGILLTKKGQLAEALRELELAQQEISGSEGTIDEARLLNETARVHRLQGHPEEAIPYLKKAMRILKGNEVAELALAHREMALCVEEQDPKEAQQQLNKAIRLYSAADEAVELAATYRVLGDLLRLQGEIEDSCDAYRTGIVALEERL